MSAGPIKTLAAAGIAGFSSILQVYRELFLLSPASRAVTGEIMMVDAGFHISGGV